MLPSAEHLSSVDSKFPLTEVKKIMRELGYKSRGKYSLESSKIRKKTGIVVVSFFKPVDSATKTGYPRWHLRLIHNPGKGTQEIYLHRDISEHSLQVDTPEAIDAELGNIATDLRMRDPAGQNNVIRRLQSMIKIRRLDPLAESPKFYI